MSMLINARKVKLLFKENHKQVSRDYLIILDRILKNIIMTSINESKNKRVNTLDIPTDLNKYIK